MRFFVLAIFDSVVLQYFEWCMLAQLVSIFIKILDPIHYDTMEDGKNQKSHFSFLFLVRIVLFLYFCQPDLFVENITSYH